MRVDLVNVFLLLFTFSRRLEILPRANINVDEQLQQMVLLTGGDSSISLSFQKREQADYIDKLK